MIRYRVAKSVCVSYSPIADGMIVYTVGMFHPQCFCMKERSDDDTQPAGVRNDSYQCERDRDGELLVTDGLKG